MGSIEMALGVMLLVPTLAAIYFGENWLAFFIPSPFFIGFGLAQYVLFRSDSTIQPSMGILLLALAWFTAFAAVTIPYMLCGFTWYDAIFESVSGLTSTGGTIAPNVDELPKSILFMRAFSQWVGGLAVVLIFMFLMPLMSVGGRALLNNELAGTDSANFSFKLISVARNFIVIYMIFTAAQIILLMLAGLSFFPSICLTMATISTGGMALMGNSVASYSFAVQLIIAIFMFLGSVNFFLHYRVFYKRDYKAYVKSQEFVGTSIWFLVMGSIMAAVLFHSMPELLTSSTESFYNTIWQVIFTTISFGSSTGFSVNDYAAWPVAISGLLFILALIGGMSGSTAGGMKIYRVLILKNYIASGYYKLIHPHAVKEVEFDKHPISQEAMMGVMLVVISFVTVIGVAFAMFFFTQPGITLMDSLGMCTISISNIGSGFGIYGPSGSQATLTVASKLLISFLMWVGRMEVFMALVLFTRTFWKDVALNSAKRIHKNPRARSMLGRK